MAWLQEMLGNSGNMGLQLTLIFVALVVALLLLFWLFRKIFGGGQTRFSKGRQPRLSVTDAAVVDDKRRLVLVRRDNVEHLVMIGGPSDIVVETNIVRAAPVAAPANPVPQNATPQTPAHASTPVETSPAPAQSNPVSQTGTAPIAPGVSTGRSTEPAPASAPTASRAGDAVAAGAVATGVAAAAAVAHLGTEDAQASISNAPTVSSSDKPVAEAEVLSEETVSDTSSEVRASLAEFASASPEPAADTADDDGVDLGGSLADSLHDALGLDAGETATDSTNEVASAAPDVSVSPESADDEMRRLLDELSAER